ncbi:MAG: LacI family DNA-binding transcriptional regulator [Chloroflexi bacterium]|nr:LacI family DNA-binding transcriptional regulator [Chloroflexota bacterium]
MGKDASARPKLLDVARHAHVSPATVSRVIHNNAPVRDNVRARVLASMHALGYEMSRATFALYRDTIAVSIPDLLNPFFSEIVRGIEDEAAANAWMMMLVDFAEDMRRERDLLEMTLTKPLDGIIVCGSRLADLDLIALREQHNTPMVLLNRKVVHPEIPCILVDFENATYRAARHLLNLGHTRLAYLAGPAASTTSRVRRHGIEIALQEVGLCLPDEWCPASFPNVDGAFQAMSALLSLAQDARPTAVLAYNDVMALGALHAIRAHRLRVPEDVSVVGFDDIAMAAHANPPLTTIAQPKYRMGKLAMRLILQIARNEPIRSEGFTLLDSPLIVRESTAPVSVNGKERA